MEDFEQEEKGIKMEEVSSSKGVQCPICSTAYHPSIIEVHASKCLFLNESANNENRMFLKRSRADTSNASKSPAAKKMNMREVGKTSDKNIGKSTSFVNNVGTSEVQLPENSVGASKTMTSVDVSKTELLKKDHIPLAEKMRPTSLFGYIGQSHLMGKRSILLQLLEKGEIPNIILWGPPGCGKTSLANVIANICKETPSGKYRYVKLSATMSGVADVKEAVKIASNQLSFGRRTVMFMDEIHRFNKAQQDIFLPHIESGTITLIGATTENPSFSLNSALLSRCRVLVLEKLSASNLVDILKRAVTLMKGTIQSSIADNDAGFSQINSNDAIPHSNITNTPKFLVDEKTIEWLAETCDGDARIALSGLELAIQSLGSSEDVLTKGPASIKFEDIKESLKKSHMLYDRKGDQHYDIISALHKSVRASDDNASLYWLARMMAGGEDPVYIARRLVRMASEDVGLADPKAMGIAIDTMHGCKMIGMPECDVLLAQCVTYLARAPKSRMMEDALRAAQRVVADQKGPQPGVPLPLRNAPTKLMKNLGYSGGYNMKHKSISGLNYLPEGLQNVNFFKKTGY